MQKDSDIPVLTDLIDKGEEFSMSDLGLDDDPSIDETMTDIILPKSGPVDPFIDNPELEQSVRRILDKHMNLAWQEIRLAIQRVIEKSRD